MILSDVSPDVCARLEEVPQNPVFWNLVGEVYPEMVDAMFDATLITGVVQAASLPYAISKLTTYFTNPKGMVAPLRLKAPYPIRKVSLAGLDKMTPNWQQMAPGKQIIGWFPLGCSGFGIYPQLSDDSQVVMDWIESPVNEARPYTGNEAIPFQAEFADLIGMYAAAMLRSKEGGAEAEEASVVLADYMSRLKALSLFQGRLDELVFTGAYGGKSQVNARGVV